MVESFMAALYASIVGFCSLGLLYFKVIKPFLQAHVTANYDKPEETEAFPSASALPEGASKSEGSGGSPGSRSARQQTIDIMALSTLVEQAVAIGVAKALSKAAPPQTAAADVTSERAVRARLLAELLAADLIVSGKRMQATATAMGVATSGRAYDEAAKVVRELEANIRRERGLAAPEVPPPLIIRDNGGPPREVPRVGPIEALVEPMPKMEPVP